MIIPLVGSTGLGVTGCGVFVECCCDVDTVVDVNVVGCGGGIGDDDVDNSVASSVVEVSTSEESVVVVISDTSLTTNFSTAGSLPLSSISIGTLGIIPYS